MGNVEYTMNRLLLAICMVAVLGLGSLGYWLVRPAPATEVRARISTVDAVNAGGQNDGFARAVEPRAFVFPQDHGPHPEFQTEWWYYTGNLATAEGRRFGFQLTFFRRALTAEPVERS
jgi:predicted secreted hydrolase